MQQSICLRESTEIQGPVMPYVIENWCESVMNCWHNTSPTDFAHVTLAVVLVGWAVTRFTSD